MEGYSYLIALGVIAVAAIVVGVMIRISHKKKAEEQTRSASKAKQKAEKKAALLKSVKKIKWGTQFSVDGGLIDRDHKTLFGLINEFNQNIPKFQSSDQMMPYLASLKNYTQTHFQREEKLQQVSAYPFRDEHKQEHDAMIGKLDGLIQKAKQANEDSVIDVAAEIGSFLQEWLTEHVIENDLPMKPYVDRMRQQAAIMGKLA